MYVWKLGACIYTKICMYACMSLFLYLFRTMDECAKLPKVPHKQLCKKREPRTQSYSRNPVDQSAWTPNLGPDFPRSSRV